MFVLPEKTYNKKMPRQNEERRKILSRLSDSNTQFLKSQDKLTQKMKKRRKFSIELFI